MIAKTYDSLEDLLQEHPRQELGKAPNLANQTFTYLTPICRVQTTSHCAYWACKCKCGKFICTRSGHLLQGRIKSCGCYSAERRSVLDASAHAPRTNLRGKKFGTLTVVDYAFVNRHNAIQWRCECDCGNTIIVPAFNLTEGVTKNCGCELEKPYIAQIKQWLIKNHISFEIGSKFPELGKAKFAFRARIDGVYYCIDVQGKQHFQQLQRYGGEPAFNQIQDLDKRKRAFCNKTKQKLITIKVGEPFEPILEKSLLQRSTTIP